MAKNLLTDCFLGKKMKIGKEMEGSVIEPGRIEREEDIMAKKSTEGVS